MMAYKLTLIFKFIEPLFWLAQALIIINLLKPLASFEKRIDEESDYGSERAA